MELIFPFIIVIPFVIGYMLGESKGVTKGADEMYSHLYSRGTRKNDTVIVELEYEDRSNTQEF